MSLFNYAKKKAFDFAKDVINQANPNERTQPGSAIRALLLLPFSLIYSRVFQDIEVLRDLYLGNYASLSEAQMDRLANNLLQERPQGSFSTTNLRIYTSEIEPFELDLYPYFRTVDGVEFSPVETKQFFAQDFFEDDDLYYVTLPVISRVRGESVEAAEITEYKNLPVDSVEYITNPSATSGGRGSLTNEEFFEYLQDTFNSRTLNDIGGVREYIIDNYPSVQEILVVPAGDDLMIRDEVWTDDGTNPNLSRQGEPFATHTDLGTLDFDTAFGRAYSASGVFTDAMEGSRASIENDTEKFRKIIKVVDENYAIFSGYPLSGSHTAELWSDGPKILTMSDVYCYIPNLQVHSTVVDKRYRLIVDSIDGTKLYYSQAETFDALPDTGWVVGSEGTVDETVQEVVSIGEDAVGTYVEVSDATGFTEDDDLSFYDMGTIDVDKDLDTAPVIYILQVDELDPISFEVERQVPETQPGNFHEPGWYFEDTDPANLFSPKESKTITLDPKADLDGFIELEESGVLQNAADGRNVNGWTFDGNKLLVLNKDLRGVHGREVTVKRDAFELETASEITGDVIAGAGTVSMVIDGMNVEFMSDKGYRDDVKVTVYDSGNNVLQALDWGEVFAWGNSIRAINAVGLFDANADHITLEYPPILGDEIITDTGDGAWFGDTFKVFNGSDWIPSSDVLYNPAQAAIEGEAVVTQVEYSSPNSTVHTNLEIPVVMGVVDATSTSPVFEVQETETTTLEFADDTGQFQYGPVRIIYATHTDIEAMQSVFDSGQDQLLCKDTLAKSFYPTLIDATVRYTGSSTSGEVYNRFVDLLQTATVEQTDGIRIELSNVVAALDEEGLADSIDLDFEVKIINFLDDGEKEVRYINPSASTNQQMAIQTAVTAGDNVITIRDAKGDIPGRGIIRMGGNNPSTQESYPYEAVIDNENGTFDIILRSGFEALYAHPQWESVYVSERDYDPELELGQIVVPKTNRPWARFITVIKENA